jgi:uncharacterized protein
MSPDGHPAALTDIAGLPAIIVGPARADATLIMAHGAGAGMEHAFMATVATTIAAETIRVVRFEFPYMAARRDGRRPGPDRPPVLLDAWRRVVAETGHPERLVIGGKSMGGRIASMVADELGVAGLVCLGYPFHPAGRPDSLRVTHLADLETRALFLQGERDTMGSRTEVEGYRLSKQIDLRWLPDGDHSFKPRKASGATEAGNLATASAAVVEFVRGVVG